MYFLKLFRGSFLRVLSWAKIKVSSARDLLLPHVINAPSSNCSSPSPLTKKKPFHSISTRRVMLNIPNLFFGWNLSPKWCDISCVKMRHQIIVTCLWLEFDNNIRNLKHIPSNNIKPKKPKHASPFTCQSKRVRKVIAFCRSWIDEEEGNGYDHKKKQTFWWGWRSNAEEHYGFWISEVFLYASLLFWLWTHLVREIWGRDKDPNTWCETRGYL